MKKDATKLNANGTSSRSRADISVRKQLRLRVALPNASRATRRGLAEARQNPRPNARPEAHVDPIRSALALQKRTTLREAQH